jgi:uroporphyrinogen decarboxylase
MMRQAGRYLPEYRAIRAQHDFLTMVSTPAVAAEVTVQPVRRLGVDAAIIFSDILVIPQSMGMKLTMVEGEGPRFPQPLRTEADFAQLRIPDVGTDLSYVYEAITAARSKLAGEVPLIGFAGAPWTLACYMIEGGGSRQFATAKRLVMQEPDRVHALLGQLADVVGEFLRAQAQAGAQVLQLFDSWAGALSPSDYRQFALPYLTRAVTIARQAGVPVIVFALGADWALEELANMSGADVIGIDWHTDAADARRRLDDRGVALQGNFDPTWLYAPPDTIRERTRVMVESFGATGYIANLGHGILPDVPVEHARAFVEAVQQGG